MSRWSLRLALIEFENGKSLEMSFDEGNYQWAGFSLTLTSDLLYDWMAIATIGNIPVCCALGTSAEVVLDYHGNQNGDATE